MYHGLAFELLLHDKEEFRMFWRMNTVTYEVKFVLKGTADTKKENPEIFEKRSIRTDLLFMVWRKRWKCIQVDFKQIWYQK